jgi:hypothetical protein
MAVHTIHVSIMDFCVYSDLSASYSLSLESQGSVEVANKMIKGYVSKLVASTNKDPKRWTSLVTVAVSNLNGQPRARKGAWSAPDLIAEGVVNPDAMLLLKDIGSPAAAMALPVLGKDHEDFVQGVRDEVI